MQADTLKGYDKSTVKFKLWINLNFCLQHSHLDNQNKYE
jgi:hypothetical protein